MRLLLIALVLMGYHHLHAQPGSYTFGVTFDIYEGEDQVDPLENSYQFHWMYSDKDTTRHWVEDVFFNAPKRSFYHTVYLSSYDLQLVILNGEGEKMVITMDFRFDPMDAVYVINGIRFQPGEHVFDMDKRRISWEEHVIYIDGLRETR